MAPWVQTVGVAMTAARNYSPRETVNFLLRASINVQDKQTNEVKTGSFGVGIEGLKKSRHTHYICAADCDTGILLSHFQIS